jgi:hypothetical protein
VDGLKEERLVAGSNENDQKGRGRHSMTRLFERCFVGLLTYFFREDIKVGIHHITGQDIKRSGIVVHIYYELVSNS